MSKDKHRAQARADELMMRAWHEKGIVIQHLGGIARSTPALQLLVSRGLMTIPLNRGTPAKWSRDFGRFFPLGCGIHGHAPRLRATLTEAGVKRAEALAASTAPRYSVASLVYGKNGEILFDRFSERN